jgi:hypothetical protein
MACEGGDSGSPFFEFQDSKHHRVTAVGELVTGLGSNVPIGKPHPYCSYSHMEYVRRDTTFQPKFN